MGIDDAVRAIEFVKPQIAIPMHYNTFEVIKADPQEFRRRVGNRADVVILKPGESLKHS
jgi:L-ascorbate metabolism protein UlaG (beta-lactamase superfamily)